MKTPKEVYMKVQANECPNVNNLILPEEWQIKAMEVYANYKLDKALNSLRNAIVQDEEEIYIGTVKNLEQSILNHKTKI